MPKRISKTRKTGRKDVNQTAFSVVQKATQSEPEIDKATISAVMRVLGSRGGKIGGKRRLETMSDEERSISASEAANARWAKKRAK